MKEYICIVCPNGCHLCYDEVNNTCTGNKCPRGAKYAFQEFTNPKRSVTSSVRTTVKGYPVISVRTDGEINKGLVKELMEELRGVIVDHPLKLNEIVIENVLNTGVNIITTTPMEGENNNE